MLMPDDAGSRVFQESHTRAVQAAGVAKSKNPAHLLNAAACLRFCFGTSPEPNSSIIIIGLQCILQELRFVATLFTPPPPPRTRDASTNFTRTWFFAADFPDL